MAYLVILDLNASERSVLDGLQPSGRAKGFRFVRLREPDVLDLVGCRYVIGDVLTQVFGPKDLHSRHQHGEVEYIRVNAV